MSKVFLRRSLEALGFVSLVALTASAPFVASSIENPLYRSVVWSLFEVLILIFALAIGLTPYWGMREMKGDVERKLQKLNDDYRRDTTKLPLISDQKNNINRFVVGRFSRVYLRNNRHVEVVIEWFNGSVFDLEFQATTGSVQINRLDIPVSSIEKRKCNHGEFCSYMVSISDNDAVGMVRSAISKNIPVELSVVLNTEVRVTYEYNGGQESTSQFKAQCIVPAVDVVALIV